MDDLKQIKRHYGENMMHLCRELFPTLLEKPGLLFKLISNKFAYSKFLYDDLIEYGMLDEFKDVIFAMVDLNKEDEIKTKKTPFELLDEAGYTLYECKTEEDIQSFKKYYAKGEELCTFRGNRLKSCYVFFAVKKNVNEIRREDFENPARQDEYGTSVISIQFNRGRINTLSIKNRYNHTVSWPDSTFSNNLDNIIEGLTYSFEKAYNLKSMSGPRHTEFKDYTIANDGKYYKYYYEEGNIYYGPNNIVIDFFSPKEYDKSRYIVFENLVLDMQEKVITNFSYVYPNYRRNEFSGTIGKIDNIEVKNNKKDKTKTIIINDDIVIILNNQNRIISYTNPHVKEICDDFLYTATEIKEINLPNVERIGDNFLIKSTKIKTINLPKVRYIGENFMRDNNIINKVNLPEVEIIEDCFMSFNYTLKEINLPKVIEIGSFFLHHNTALEKVYLPEVKGIRSFFLTDNNKVKEISLPKIEVISDYFMCGSNNNGNVVLEKIDLPEVINIGDNFLRHNNSLKVLNLPKVVDIGEFCLKENNSIEKVYLPNIEGIENHFLESNDKLEEIYVPNVVGIGDKFLYCNNSLKSISLPKVEIIGDDFLYSNTVLELIDIPLVTRIYDGFLSNNQKLKIINLPSLKNRNCIGKDFLSKNQNIKTVQDEEGYCYIKK